MQLHVIGSNSAGNAYFLRSSTGEILLIELGVRFDKIKAAVQYQWPKISGAVVSHAHLDHALCMREMMQMSIPVYASKGTHTARGTIAHHRAKILQHGVPVRIGSFRVQPFDVKHDCTEPFGFLIQHEECGTVLFLTDSYFVEYTFPGLNNIMIEANYCQHIVDEKLRNGGMKFLRDRVLESHMSIDTCIKTLMANDLTAVNNIVLIHLSNSNSNAEEFQNRVTANTACEVIIAEAGITIPFNKTPY